MVLWGSITYTYDAVGNRLTKTEGTQTTYTYGAYNRLTQAGSTTYTYDNNGNMVSKNDGVDSWTYTYDYNNMMTKDGRTLYKIHLYSLKRFFFSQATAEVGDTVAPAWCGRKAYLSTYLSLPLEERQRLYLKVMPRPTIFTSYLPKTEDRLRERLKKKGPSDDVIDQVLEGLALA